MNSDQSYIPISCSFYDYLEEAATLKQKSTIKYLEEGNTVQVEYKIHALVLKDKVEYMVLENGQSIRLDHLISFNGELLPKSCSE